MSMWNSRPIGNTDPKLSPKDYKHYMSYCKKLGIKNCKTIDKKKRFNGTTCKNES